MGGGLFICLCFRYSCWFLTDDGHAGSVESDTCFMCEILWAYVSQKFGRTEAKNQFGFLAHGSPAVSKSFSSLT